jgi:hypothetical protein
MLGVVSDIPTGVASGIGSLPGTDPVEAARLVLGELPDLPHLPELPNRGAGADLIGRTAALLVDLAVEIVPSGWRVTDRRGVDHRRGIDFLAYDLDGFEQVVSEVRARPGVVKTQAVGPWTLAAGVELVRGHRVLTDRGAVREFTASLTEGLLVHLADLARRTGARVVLQLDEPSLPSVLRGSLPTASGYGTVAAVTEVDAADLLREVITPLRAAGVEVITHCCVSRPPIGIFRSAGATGLAVDLTVLAEDRATLDAMGEAVQAGTVLFAGVVPSTAPSVPPDARRIAEPVLRLLDRLGFPREVLSRQTVATPTCGLAGADAAWTRTALTASRELAKAFVEPPESW